MGQHQRRWRKVIQPPITLVWGWCSLRPHATAFRLLTNFRALPPVIRVLLSLEVSVLCCRSTNPVLLILVAASLPPHIVCSRAGHRVARGEAENAGTLNSSYRA